MHKVATLLDTKIKELQLKFINLINSTKRRNKKTFKTTR